MGLDNLDRPEFERVYYQDWRRGERARRSKLELVLTVGQKRELLVAAARERLFGSTKPEPFTGPAIIERARIPLPGECNKRAKVIPAPGLRAQDCY